MFKGLREAGGYDVYEMETVGRSEKCVDIQLATELLQSNTDIAVLLTGDKDFLPAMIRAQKQKKVALVSMRRSCNKSLYEASQLDYDVIWLDDLVEQLVIPKDIPISVFTVAKVLVDYIQEAPPELRGSVSSRDVGRYLKLLKVGKDVESGSASFASDISLGEQLKLYYGGLRPFVQAMGNIFYIDDSVINKDDPTDMSYWIGLRPGADGELLQEAKQQRTKFTAAEKAFFDDSYTLAPLEDKARSYGYSLLVRQQYQLQRNNVSSSYQHHHLQQLPDDLTRDYSACTVAQLKERCKERGLPVSGVKSALLERIETDVKEQIEELEMAINNSRDGKEIESYAAAQSQQPDWAPPVSEATAGYLEDLVVEYLRARGGKASSRDVGRYLAANRVPLPDATGGSSATHSNSSFSPSSALQELKTHYGSLQNFIACRPERIEKSSSVEAGRDGNYGFEVTLKDEDGD